MSAIGNSPRPSPETLLVERAGEHAQNHALWSRWMEFGGFLILLALAYWTVIVDTASILNSSDDFAHGMFAPLVAAFIIWDRRKTLFNVTDSPRLAGLFVLTFGILVGGIGVVGASSTVGRFGAIISLLGAAWLIGGDRTFRQMLFPVGFLLFTFPIPGLVYAEITMPLQRLAAILAENTLDTMGITVIREGNILRLSHVQLSVAEACSGIRSLITIVFFSTVYANFFESRLWMRFGLVLAAIPFAILMNSMRIVASGILSRRSYEWVHGQPHDMLGYGALVFSFLLIYALHQLVKYFLRSPSKRASATTAL